LEHYLSQTGTTVNWLTIGIKNIDFDGRRANVVVELEYVLELPMGAGEEFGKISKNLDEVWLWVDGQWWYTSDSSGVLGK
jgi:hypothetical protein